MKRSAGRRPERREAHLPVGLGEPLVVRVLLVALALGLLALLVVLPVGVVFVEGFARGYDAWLAAIRDDGTRSAIGLTLLTAAISVPVNTLFGLGAAWLLARYRFRGRDLLLTVLDLPLGVSPVISGLVFVLLFGRQGLFGRFLSEHDIKIIFAVPGVVLATTFVTLPIVAREVLPLLEAQGASEEEAALTLGAGGLRVLFEVTLPKIRFGLLYGVILANARAMGEFGAVSVVSGHIRGATTTLPLHIEILYNEYNAVGAFAVASLLALLAGITLVARQAIGEDHALGAPSR